MSLSFSNEFVIRPSNTMNTSALIVSLFGLLTLTAGIQVANVSEPELRDLFTFIDSNGDSLLSKDEYSIFLQNELGISWTEDFTQKDIAKDNTLEYNELVYYFKEFVVSSPALIFDALLESERNEMEQFYDNLPIPQQAAFDEQIEAELLASSLFYDADIDRDGNITKREYQQFMADSEWADFIQSLDAKTTLNFEQFTNYLFESELFAFIQDVEDATETELAQLNAVKATIDSAHLDAQNILLQMAENAVFTVHELDQYFNNESFPETTMRRMAWSTMVKPDESERRRLVDGPDECLYDTSMVGMNVRAYCGSDRCRISRGNCCTTLGSVVCDKHYYYCSCNM